MAISHSLNSTLHCSSSIPSSSSEDIIAKLQSEQKALESGAIESKEFEAKTSDNIESKDIAEDKAETIVHIISPLTEHHRTHNKGSVNNKDGLKKIVTAGMYAGFWAATSSALNAIGAAVQGVPNTTVSSAAAIGATGGAILGLARGAFFKNSYDIECEVICIFEPLGVVVADILGTVLGQAILEDVTNISLKEAITYAGWPSLMIILGLAAVMYIKEKYCDVSESVSSQQRFWR